MSQIIQLGHEFDAAYAGASETALRARPLFLAWEKARGRHSVADAFKMAEFKAFAPVSREWSARSGVTLKIAEQLAGMQPATMAELVVVARAYAYTLGSEHLCEDHKGLFHETSEYEVLAFAEKLALGHCEGRAAA